MTWPTTTPPKLPHPKQEPQVTVFEMAASLESGDGGGSGTHTPIILPPCSPASMSTTSIPIQQATPVSHNLKGANFHGSFAAITARHKTKHLHNRPWYRRYAYFTGGWGDRAIWRAGVVEAVGTFCLTWLVGQSNIVLANMQGQHTTVQTAASNVGYVALWSAALLAVLVAATAPGSGGHLNPMVTFSTVLCGLCPLSRGRTSYHGGGCFYDSSVLEPTQVLLIEAVSCFILLFLIFGVGLDPRQAALFGPHLVPVLVGLCFGVVAFVSQGLSPRVCGRQYEPGQVFRHRDRYERLFWYVCLDLYPPFPLLPPFFVTEFLSSNNINTAISVAQWIWWVGGLIGGIMQAILYNFNPPWQVHGDEAKDGTPRAP
ncbi:MIP transporter [Apiospora arundinis]